jgi:hypothetical protein
MSSSVIHLSLQSRVFVNANLDNYNDLSNVIQTTPKDLLEVLVVLVTRLRAKTFKKTFNGLLQDT